MRFRTEVLELGLSGYNKILEAEKSGVRPLYRLKSWKAAECKQKKREKKKNWLGPFWNSCIFIPPTPGSELKKRMQQVEEITRFGGRENWPIKIVKMAGTTLDQTLV